MTIKAYNAPLAFAIILSSYSYAGSHSYTENYTEKLSHVSSDSHIEHDSDYLKLNLSKGWFDSPAVHDHTSDNDRSRYIHPITTEAAFNDNDFFIDYAFNKFSDEDEHEIELELEYALTRRLGLVIETAFEFENEGGSTNEGFADLEIAARAVLAEYEKAIVTFNVGFGIPTGNNDFSSDELEISPSFLTWYDFGYGITFHSLIGLEIGTRSNSLEFVYESATIKDFGGGFALSLESQTIVDLRDDDEDEDDVESNLSVGGIYRFNNSNSIRAAYTFPLTDDEFDGGAVLSYNYSF